MIENLKDKYFPVLDHGFVAVKDWMGSDASIATAARCSYGEGTKKISDDRALIRTLIREQHTSPLEMCELVVHVGLPIFVARQWVRHRTASLNEYSGRYSVMPMLFYKPESERLLSQNPTNKQGSSDERAFTPEQEGVHRTHATQTVMSAVNEYTFALDCDLSRELARIDLPLSMYTYWYWKIDINNLLKFLYLRLDEHAQWEIRQYSEVLAGIIKQWLPSTWEAFEDYRLNGVCFSRQERCFLKDIVEMRNHDILDPDDFLSLGEACVESGMTKRETASFLQKLKFDVSTKDYSLDLSKARDAAYYEELMRKHAYEVSK